MAKPNKRERTILLNGCSVSKFSVIPSNWEDKGASIDTDWKIFYRFYDPAFKDKYPNGKLCVVKGMNEYKTLMARRQVTIDLLEYEKDQVLNKGRNPITKQLMKPDVAKPVTGIPQDTPFVRALDLALEKKKCTPETRICLRSVVKYVSTAATQMGYDQRPVTDIKRSDIMAMLEQCGVIKGEKWTANNFNHYRSHLQMLYEVLVLWCNLDYNPVDKIPIEKHVRAKSQILTIDERKRIDQHLRKNNYPFWLFMQIFFMSGCREIEQLRVKGKDVDIAKQKFTALKKKGRSYTYVDYTITDISIPLWQMALVNCGPEDYVFSVGLKPGTLPIRREQISRRWRRWVKKGLGIDKEFYPLKHLQSTEISRKHGTQVAAAFNNESEEMIRKHYDVEFDAREHEAKKKQVKDFFG